MRIGIGGFGVAGGALGILLARAGHAVTILERTPKVGPVGAGFLLQPAGQEVLARLGMLDRIVAGSARIERLEALTHHGRQLTELHYQGAASGACAYGVRRSLLFTALQSKLTMQHELALVVAMEQLYRAYTIKAGLPYHRD